MVAKKVKKQKVKQKQKQKQTQKQSVNVNVKIDQSKKGTKSIPKTIVQRVGPQIVMTSAGSYNFPQRTLESNNQYNQLASIMEKIVENERYKASKGDALDLVRERRIDHFEPNVARNGLASVNNDIDMMSTLTRDEEEVIEPEEEEEEEEEEVIVPEEEEDNQIVVPQGTDPNLSMFDADTLVEENENPMRIKDKNMIRQKYSYPNSIPFDAFDKFFNTQTGRWNSNKNVRKQKDGYRMKEASDAHFKKNV